MLEQKQNNEQKADVANRQPAYCKAVVGGRQIVFVILSMS
jgi:hypothetical protein